MKSKKIYNIFSSIVLTALLLVGCEYGPQKADDLDGVPVPDYNEVGPTDEEEYEDGIKLEEISDLSMTIPITASKNYSWEAKSLDGWCRVLNEMPTVGNQDLDVEFDLNRTNEDRSGTVLLTMTTDYGTSSSNLKFIQTCFPLRQIELANPAGGGVENIQRASDEIVATLKYNYDVDVSVEYDGEETGWITLPTDPIALDEDGSLGNAVDYIINVATNNASDPQSTRMATVVFTNVGEGLEGDEPVVKKIVINQSADILPLHLDATTESGDELTLLGEGEDIIVSLQYNYDVDVSIEYESGSDWITLSDDPIRLSNDGTFSDLSEYIFTVLPYDSNTPRKATVVFTNVGPENVEGILPVVKKITISQTSGKPTLPAGAVSFKDNFGYMQHSVFSSIVATYPDGVAAANWLHIDGSIICYSYDWGNDNNTNVKLCNGGDDQWMVTNALNPKESVNDIFSFWWSNNLFGVPTDYIEVLYTTDEITASNCKNANWIAIDGSKLGDKTTGVNPKELFTLDFSGVPEVVNAERVFFAIKYNKGAVREYFIDDVRFGIEPKAPYVFESDDN